MEATKRHRCFGGDLAYYRHDSDACGGTMELSVFVPPGDGPFPVVTFLSGLTCTPENFTTKAGAYRAATELGLIVVAPDTSPRGAGYPGEDDAPDFGSGASFYVDATESPWSERYRMATYITEELPAALDAHLRTKGPGYRSLMGHSMGGHGALALGLRNPEGYRSISAFSPVCAPTRVPWGQKAFSGYLGDDPQAWKLYDASELVRARQHPTTILIDQGTDDGFLDAQLRPELFRKACEEAGQPLELRMQPGYDHSYFFIATFIDDHLHHHARHLAR